MHTFYEILLVPNNEGETTISFFTNGKRYLFNCSENLNRFCTECGVRIFSNLDHIFIPHISPTYLGGLPGAIITSSELQPANKLHLYGPPNLWHYLTSLRPFVKTSMHFKIMLNQMMEHQLDQDYLFHSDENLTVRGLLLKSDRASRGDYHSHLQQCDFGAPFVLRNANGSFRKHSSNIVGNLSWDFLFSTKKNDNNKNTSSSNSSGRDSQSTDLSPMKKKQKKESEACYYSFKNRLNIQPLGEFEITQNETLREMLKHMHPTMADYCLCFLCKTADIPGKFDAEKANLLGIVGADRGRLVKGETIQVNGRTIKPEDIISPPTPGSEVLIINCPNEHYLTSLLSNKHFEKYMSTVVSVIHCVPHHILTTPQYREFMDKFHKECDHVIVNEDSSKDASSFVSSCTNITEFSLVDKELFTQCLTPNYKSDSGSNRSQVIEQHPNAKVVYGESLMRYNLIPVRYRGIDNSKVSYIHKIDPEQVEQTFYQNYPAIAKHLNDYKERVAKESDLNQTESHPQANILKKCSDEEFEIIFLGTGSSIPSKYRNVTGILLNLFDRGAILFDCGEGTLSQIYRACGKEKQRPF
ncbi:hypothetical protein FDP41_004637 [Naegleria fowleri]|uniref:ribonuclease Z n=1 Tax=Naegleria fowleri TaxID=5763 RepID=A0A6A5BQ15_NAEFO|nr:uncharacterized protein FDP41_004637 [Naegleria fowleri]KAF0976331.1 hypothetical protein FDP41_004637 [Naegleria fowleri]